MKNPSWLCRSIRLDEIGETFVVRANTAENSISAERLDELGITPESIAVDLQTGQQQGWICRDAEKMLGFCFADMHTGEVIVVAVLKNYEGKGIGKRLLQMAVSELQSRNSPEIWLWANANPEHRALRFYQEQGWALTGEVLPNTDAKMVYKKT
jgi:ribosomal protein S18 acetylase RimI-like enzyme